MKPRTPTARAAGRALTLAAALGLTLALALLPGAAPAGAHDGGGTITVEQVHPAGLSVHYIVMLTWDNDGHPAADATITATPIGPDGDSLTPTTLAPSGAGDGRYSGAVEFPSAGAWTVRFTSIEPTGSAERPEQVTEPTTTTAAPGDEGSGDGATATTQAGVALADDDTGGSAEAADESDGSDDGGIPVLLIVGAAVIAVGGVVTALLAIRRYRPDLEAGEPAAAAGHADDGGAAEAGPAGEGASGPAAPGEPGPDGPRSPAAPEGGGEAPSPAPTEPKGP